MTRWFPFLTPELGNIKTEGILGVQKSTLVTPPAEGKEEGEEGLAYCIHGGRWPVAGMLRRLLPRGELALGA